MKKVTLAISALALAVNTASAITVYENEDLGTKVDFTGSARLKWTSNSNKTSTAAGTTREHINEAVRNNSSRFGFKASQELGYGYYGIGRVEWRFRGTSRSQHDFDDIYTRQLYAGIGNKKYGEVLYGNMTVITDEVKQTDLPNTLSLSEGLLVGSARRALQYSYQGIEGLKVGGFYGDRSQRGNNGLDLAVERKDVWGLAAIYKHKIDDKQSATVATGVTRERFMNDSNRTAYSLGTKYTFDKTTLGLDLERSIGKNQSGILGNKRTQNQVRTVVYQKVTDQLNAYTMYAFKTDKTSANNRKAKTHEFMVGTEYYIVPKYLKTFVEWKTASTKNYTNGAKTSKVRDNTTVIGVRAYW
ncbi:porin [Haemophilus paracuniculus]|uniref:Outer membrane protein P2 n=1 Tax=Haemophilus paracuniculus TaxID=734 RepID=A0A1T0ATX0_9PAST|nr:porin [Haemophilus paracuniculus]OOR99918.1 porin [Haemophilus paracuniculus]